MGLFYYGDYMHSNYIDNGRFIIDLIAQEPYISCNARLNRRQLEDLLERAKKDKQGSVKLGIYVTLTKDEAENAKKANVMIKRF